MWLLGGQLTCKIPLGPGITCDERGYRFIKQKLTVVVMVSVGGGLMADWRSRYQIHSDSVY